MKDLVKRLREGRVWDAALQAEAADEIERLRTALRAAPTYAPDAPEAALFEAAFRQGFSYATTGNRHTASDDLDMKGLLIQRDGYQAEAARLLREVKNWRTRSDLWAAENERLRGELAECERHNDELLKKRGELEE
jgi:hypothetical protein